VTLQSTPAAPRVRERNSVLGRLRKPSVYLAAGFILLLLLVAIFAEVIAPYPYSAQDLTNTLQGPSWEHWMGTDHLGRDVLSRLMFATRLTLLAPLLSVGIALLLALPTGLFAGYRRGWVDAVTGRIAEVFLSLPGLVFALVLVAVLGRGLFNAMLALGIAFAPGLYRVVRAATLGVVGETYIESARSIGSSTPRIVFVHIVPNIMAPLVVQVTILMGISIIAEAALSFIGVGAQPPSSSLGTMLRDAYDYQYQAPFAVLYPGIALVLTVLCFNTLGDRFRDALLGEQR
jgi:peptide/nickel transport system permease protein